MWRFICGVALLAMIASGCADDAVETSTTSTAPTTTTTVSPGADLEAAFMAEIGSLAAALDNGDLDTYLGLLQASLSGPELDRAAFFAVAAPVHVLVDECEVLSVSDFVSEAVCPVEITEPVRLEFGDPEGGIQLLRYGDGLSPVHDGTLDFRQYTEASMAYGSYLQQYMPDEYAAACDPDAYDREIRFEYSVSLTPECGGLLAEVADDVAQWVRDGQPSP